MEKIVGFDIGESSVKLVYFAGADLKKAVTAELPDNMVSGSRILSMDAMADFLRQTAKSNGIPLTHAALVLPSTEVFTRELVMPAMTEQQLLYNLPYEFRDYLTEEKNKYFFDYSMREVLRDESGQPTEMNLLAWRHPEGHRGELSDHAAPGGLPPAGADPQRVRLQRRAAGLLPPHPAGRP